MSRVRTGWGDGDWLDQGPAHAIVSGYGGSMVVSSEPDKATPAELALRQAVMLRGNDRAAPKKKSGPPKRKFCIENCNRIKGHRGRCTPAPELCGAIMLIARETCARRAGHVDGRHATRLSMQNKSKFMVDYKRRRAA